MDLLKLLIADDCDEFRQALADSLSNSYVVRACRSGDQTLELLHSFRPDILVTDLMLSGLDGLTLLQMTADTGIQPKVLVVTSHYSPYIQATLERLQVAYIMRKPCSIQAVVCRLSDFAAELAPLPATSYDPEDLISNVLLHLGLAAHLDGFRYLLTAIPLYTHDTNQAITKELYASVAELHGKTAKQVERSIRSAIDRAWKLSDHKHWAQYFTPGPDGSVARPSNGRFIGRMARLLIEQCTKSRVC